MDDGNNRENISGWVSEIKRVKLNSCAAFFNHFLLLPFDQALNYTMIVPQSRFLCLFTALMVN